MIDAAERLRGAGLRVTEPRRAVVEALHERAHASAEELYAVVARSLPATSLQSVYNALGDFVDAGLVRRIEPAGRPGLFELRVADNHHHLICSVCGAVEDVDCVVGEAPCLAPSEARGYTLHVAEVTFYGVCPACAEARSVEESATSPRRRPAREPDVFSETR